MFARQVAELLDHTGIRRAVIVGFSLGGSVAQCFCFEYPDRAAALIVVAAVCNRLPEERQAVEVRAEAVRAGGPAAVVEGALQRWFSPGFAERNPDVVDYWRRKTLANDPAAYAAAYALYADTDRHLFDRIPQIAAPTLILTGDRDIGQTPRMSYSMGSRIPGAEVRIVEGIPHMFPIEAAEELNAAIPEFLARRGVCR
jgi:pimeloyl-ACP methyl ester carboxylesterase